MTQFQPPPRARPDPRPFTLALAPLADKAWRPGLALDPAAPVVASVAAGGSAAAAGLEPGFTVLEVGGIRVGAADDFADALFYFRRKKQADVELLCIPDAAPLAGGQPRRGGPSSNASSKYSGLAALL